MGKVKALHTLDFGRKISTVGELRYLLADLDDHDQIVLATCDEDGDEQDHYPMYMDLYEDIELTDGTVVRELRFCQMPHESIPIKHDAVLIPVCPFKVGEVAVFKIRYGQVHGQLCMNIGCTIDTEKPDKDYFWLPKDKMWYPKHTSMYNNLERQIADWLCQDGISNCNNL